MKKVRNNTNSFFDESYSPKLLTALPNKTIENETHLTPFFSTPQSIGFNPFLIAPSLQLSHEDYIKITHEFIEER